MTPLYRKLTKSYFTSYFLTDDSFFCYFDDISELSHCFSSPIKNIVYKFNTTEKPYILFNYGSSKVKVYAYSD